MKLVNINIDKKTCRADSNKNKKSRLDKDSVNADSWRGGKRYKGYVTLTPGRCVCLPVHVVEVNPECLQRSVLVAGSNETPSHIPVEFADYSRLDADHLVILFVAEIGQALRHNNNKRKNNTQNKKNAQISPR